MSSSKAQDQTIEDIEAKPASVTERCGVRRASRLPTHARSPSTSGQKSKIPTNIGHTLCAGPVTQSQVHDSSRNLTSVASEEAGIGNASPMNCPRFPTSKSLIAASSSPVTTKTNKLSNNSAMLKRHLENQFTTKKKRYASLRKELSDKQQNAANLYDEMSELRAKLMANGARDPGKIETINLISIPVQNCSTRLPIDSQAFRGSGEHVFVPNSSLTREFVSSTVSKIPELLAHCHEMCDEALRKRSEILDLFLKVKDSKDEAEINSQIAEQIETHKNESSTLESRLAERRKIDETLINETLQKFSTLWNEVEISRERIRQLENIGEEITNEMSVKVNDALKEKESFVKECDRLREREVTLETDLQKLRTKVRGMETRINEDETKIGQLQCNAKNLETQIKQKDTSAERQLRDVERSLKSSQILLAKTEKQRDTFESRLNELKKSFGSKQNETDSKVKEMSEKLTVVNAELAKAREERRDDEMEVNETCNETLQIRLAERDEKIATLQREKQEIIKAVNSDFFSDRSDLVEDDIHDNIIKRLTKKMQEFRSSFKIAQDKNANLQRQLTEFRSRVHGQSKDSDKVYSANRITDLEKQVSELRFSVQELTRRNEELEITLNQKQLEIEEQDRVLRERSNVMKVRDEVIDLIRGKTNLHGNGAESGHLSLVKKKNNQRDREQVDKHIAEKTENLQQLYTTLETKQMQITQLEQLVRQMEIQQESAQEQRTRLEKQIAQLQLAMHYKKRHRYVNPESLKLSSAKLSSPTFRESAQQNGDQPLSGSETFTTALQASSFPYPRSFTRPSQSRSPIRQPQIQRSITLNSFNVKTRSSPSKVYASQVMDEVARALKRERDYDYKKRGLTGHVNTKYSREDRGTGFVDRNVVDYMDIAKDEIHESIYNSLFEPWMFEGAPSNVIVPSNDRSANNWTANRLPNSTLSFRVRSNDRSPRMQRAPNDCSRESRCDSPECRKNSLLEWNCTTIPTRARTSPQETRSRRS